MNILLDGYAMSLAKGTGLTTYASNTLSANVSLGNDVSVLTSFGGQKAGSEGVSERWKDVTSSAEPKRNEWNIWGKSAVSSLVRHCLGKPNPADFLPLEEGVDIEPILKRFGDPVQAYTCPFVFRSAQALSRITRRPLNISLSGGKKPDLFHSTTPLVPLSVESVPKVTTILDLIPLVVTGSTDVNLSHYRKLVRQSVETSEAIFTISESAKQDLVKLFPVPAERIHVTYLAVTIPQEYRNEPSETTKEILQKEFGVEGEFLLFVGAIEPKKNVARLIEAYLQADTRLPLYIVGKDGWMFEDVKRRIEEFAGHEKGGKQIVRLNYLSYPHLIRFMKAAKALVFPSLYEGFGLPVLESMLLGTPAITSRRGSLEEVGGEAAYYVDPEDVTSIAAGIDEVDRNSDLRNSMIEKGFEQGEFFSMEKYRERLATGYAMLGK